MMILGVWYQISGFVEELQVKESFVFGKNSMKRIFIFNFKFVVNLGLENK